MRAYVQVLTTPTADTPGTTLVLHFDSKRYMIGSMGEGTQRAAVEMGFRFSKLSECFVTGRTEWTNVGGLIGMILCLADSSAARRASLAEEAQRKASAKAKRLGVLDDASQTAETEASRVKQEPDSLTVFAPTNLNYAIATARRFVFRKSMPVDIHEIVDGKRMPESNDESAPYWMDENVKVWSVVVEPDGHPPSAPRPISPRKRSVDEMYRDELSNGPERASPAATGVLTAKAVVTEMFNSTWNLDKLHETRLGNVKLPAALFVRDEKTKGIKKYGGPLPGEDSGRPVDLNQKVLVRKPWPGALVETLPPTTPSKGAVSYIFRTHTQRGKFNPVRARELKVKEGRSWAALARGEAVENEDGEMITSDQVLGPSRIGGGVAVVDVPDVSYLEPTLRRAEWRNESIMNGVGAMMWILGPGVAHDDRLRKFMDEFKQLNHVVSSPEHCPNNIAMDTAAGSTIRLQRVDPKRYGTPVHSNTAVSGKDSFDEKAQPAIRGQCVLIEPTPGVDNKQTIPFLDVAEAAAGVDEAILHEAEKARSANAAVDAETQRWRDSLPAGSAEAEVIALGTGSSLPSKYRNVSATLLRVPDWGSVLFDCGENTLGQLKRIYPAEEMKQLLRDLRIIFISHMHADHHLGTAGVIKAWYQEVHDGVPLTKDQDPKSSFNAETGLVIVAESAMQHWLHEYSAVEDIGYSRLAPVSMVAGRQDSVSRMSWFVPPSMLKNKSFDQRQAVFEEKAISPSDLRLADLQAAAVKHCHGSRAVSVTFPSGFKASYSGDCRPSKHFAEIGKGSTVCIHEATFDDALRGDAVAKRHSTTSEALGVAQAMGAKACVLTHFSQRYSKIPVLEKGEGDDAVALKLPESNEPEEEEEADGPIENDTNPRADPSTAVTNGEQASTTGAVKFKLNSDMKVCVAFDYMRVKVGEIPELDKFTPALLKLFAEEEKKEEVEEVVEQAESKGKKKGKSKKKSQPNA